MTDHPRTDPEREVFRTAELGLAITMFVPLGGGNTTARFVMQANDKDEPPEDPRPLLRKAIAAMQDELAGVDDCPVHAALSALPDQEALLKAERERVANWLQWDDDEQIEELCEALRLEIKRQREAGHFVAAPYLGLFAQAIRSLPPVTDELSQ